MRNLKEITREGNALYREGRLDEAIDCYDRVLETDPGCLFACVAKAIVLMKMNKYDEALGLLEAFDIQDDDPLASWAFFKKSVALYQLGRPDEAISCLDMVKDSDPNYADSRFNKAVILEEYHMIHGGGSKLEECLSCYDEAVAARPDFADAMYNKGLVLQKLRRPEDALESFEKAIKASPGLAKAHDSKGSVLNFMGRYEEAMPCYREAVRLKPDFAEALYNMANTLYHLGRIEEAKLALEKAVRLDPDLPDHAEIMSMLDNRLEFNWKIRGHTPPEHGDGIRRAEYSQEMDRTRDVLSRVAPVFPFVLDCGDFGHVETYGLAGRGAKCRLLRLDTAKDVLVAELQLLGGCTFRTLEYCYYRHLDESGWEHFYKIGPGVAGSRMPPRMLEKVNRCLRDMGFDPSDARAAAEAVKKAMLALRSKVIAAHVFGARVMTRKEVLRDFDRLEDGCGLNICDAGLERDYYPRPTARGFGGYPVHGAVEMQEAEKRLYWDLLKRREPIPPEVWRFLEETRRFRFDPANPVWKKEVRIAKRLAAVMLPERVMEKEIQDAPAGENDSAAEGRA